MIRCFFFDLLFFLRARKYPDAKASGDQKAIFPQE